MTSTAEPVALKLLDRESHIACAPEERAGLVSAAQYLDAKMREMKANTRAPGFDRVAVLAAVSIAHELLGLKTQHEAQELALTEGLGMLRKKLEGVLEGHLK
jgi:cell division protein ZapA